MPQVKHASALLASAETLTSLEISGEECYVGEALKDGPDNTAKATLVAGLPALQHVQLSFANSSSRQPHVHMPFLPAVA